ncbi:hypothetical protein OH492_28665 [Vibrio chagasii]|nr:hypothetical protein [Vibrio chagasii]
MAIISKKKTRQLRQMRHTVCVTAPAGIAHAPMAAEYRKGKSWLQGSC